MARTAEVILRVDQVSRCVVDDGQRRCIVRDISYSFEQGGMYMIFGPSGAGKSSLLRLLNRLDEPDSGQVLFHDRPATELPPTELRRRVGYLFQRPHLFDGKVADNVRFAAAEIDDSRVSELVDSVGLPERLIGADIAKLSGGESQRVALARLLATDPEVVLLDEPTSSLDPTHTQSIEALIVKLAADHGATVIMVSHDPAQALRMGGQALLLADGALIESGRTEQVVNDPRTEIGKRYRRRELT